MKVVLLKCLSKKITAFYLQLLIIFNKKVAAWEPSFCYNQQQCQSQIPKKTRAGKKIEIHLPRAQVNVSCPHLLKYDLPEGNTTVECFIIYSSQVISEVLN